MNGLIKILSLVANALFIGLAVYAWRQGELSGFWCAVVLIQTAILSIHEIRVSIEKEAH